MVNNIYKDVQSSTIKVGISWQIKFNLYNYRRQNMIIYLPKTMEVYISQQTPIEYTREETFMRVQHLTL